MSAPRVHITTTPGLVPTLVDHLGNHWRISSINEPIEIGADGETQIVNCTLVSVPTPGSPGPEPLRPAPNNDWIRFENHGITGLGRRRTVDAQGRERCPSCDSPVRDETEGCRNRWHRRRWRWG